MATQQRAITKYAVAGGTKLAYRQFGRSATAGFPLVMLMHFRGNMDFWDPALINALAAHREIILLDNAGIGKSEGEIPLSIKRWAKHVIDLMDALSVDRFDLLGFSVGGCCGQHVALAVPHRVRKMILAGTPMSRTPNINFGNRETILFAIENSETEEEFKTAIELSFYNSNPRGQAAAVMSWKRIMSRKHDREPHLNSELAKRQTEAFARFTSSGPDNPYERINELTMPVFVANGDNDLMVPTESSIELARLLPNAQLHIYADCGHGFLFQYPALFANHVNLFLEDEQTSGCIANVFTL